VQILGCPMLFLFIDAIFRRICQMIAQPWAENMEVRHVQTAAEVVWPII
jgi:hypothetical protein